MSAYSQLCTMATEMALLESTSAVLGWDQETYMPPKALEHRAQQVGYLGGKGHALFTSKKFRLLLDKAVAMAQAAQSGLPTATGRQRLPHLPVERPYCVMVFLPLYPPGGLDGPPGQRPLRGYLLGMLTLSDVVEQSLAQAASAQVNLLLEDQSEAGAGRLTYGPGLAGDPGPPAAQLSPELFHVQVFAAAGRQWRVTATPSAAVRASAAPVRVSIRLIRRLSTPEQFSET